MKSDSVQRVSGLLFEAIMLAFILGYYPTGTQPDTLPPAKHFYGKTTAIESIIWYSSPVKRILKPTIDTHNTIIDFQALLPNKIYLPNPFKRNFELTLLSISILINAP